MGWLSMPRASMGANPTPKQYLDAQFTYEQPEAEGQPGHGFRVLASSYHDAYYAAVQRYDANGPGETFAVVCLVRWNPRAADGYVFAYQDMDETCGPHQVRCPLKVLELLSPTDHPYALDWRRRCHETLQRRKPLPPDGALLRFAQPITFSNGTSYQFMRVKRDGRTITLTSRDGHGHYKVSRLVERDFEIVREGTVAPTFFQRKA